MRTTVRTRDLADDVAPPPGAAPDGEVAGAAAATAVLDVES
nr:hypothetical protein [Gordonia sputi]